MKNPVYYIIIIVLLSIILLSLFYYETPNTYTQTHIEQFSEDIYGNNTAYRFPGSACPFGQDENGCFDYTACNGWKGQTVNPATGLDMSGSVSLLCGNVGKENSLHKSWNKSWITDPSKKDGGKLCNNNLTGFTCKSGLCLDTGKNKFNQKEYHCAGYIEL